MDEATALKVLQNYGAPMTPQNLMRVMQQTGPTDAILAKSMGLQGAVDESGSTLDKLAFDSQRSPATVPVQEAAGSPITPNPDPIAKAVTAVAATPNKGRSGSAASTEPEVVPAANTAQAGYNAPSIWQWLLPTLGITSAAGTRAMAPDATPTKAPLRMIGNDGQPLQVEGPDPNAKRITYQPKIEGPAITTGSGPAPDATAIDKLMTDSSRSAITPNNQPITESSRPINTNSDGRNSEQVNKPVNIDTQPQAKGPYDGEPTNLVEEIAKTIRKLKGVRK